MNGNRDSAEDALDGMLLIDFLKDQDKNHYVSSRTRTLYWYEGWRVYDLGKPVYSGPSLSKALKALKK